MEFTKIARYKSWPNLEDSYIETDKFCELWDEKSWDEIDYKGFYDPPYLHLRHFMTPLGISIIKEDDFGVDLELFEACLDHNSDPNAKCSDGGSTAVELIISKIASNGVNLYNCDYISFILKRLIYSGADFRSESVSKMLKEYPSMIRRSVEAIIEDMMYNYVDNPCALRWLSKNVGTTLWLDCMPLVIGRLVFSPNPSEERYEGFVDTDMDINVPVEGWDSDLEN